MREIDALISVGGDGSMSIANGLAQKGLRVVGVPKTIDNDLDETVVTFGFDTAVSFAVECLDRLHATALARTGDRGGGHGTLRRLDRLEAGVAGSADVILIPEVPFDLQKVAEKIRNAKKAAVIFPLSWWRKGPNPLAETRW
jgi:6-phosphofructokinase 1